MHVVTKLVRPLLPMPNTEYATVILRQMSELVKGVLETQISQLDLVYDLFACLRIYRNVFKVSLIGNFSVVIVYSSAKSLLVPCDNYELSLEPLKDLYV